MTSGIFVEPSRPDLSNYRSELEGKKMQVSISTDDVKFTVDITDEAQDDVRLKFNPSNLDDVATLKLLAAAYLSLLTRIRDDKKTKGVDAGREFAIARTDFQKVSMTAVLAATKGL